MTPACPPMTFNGKIVNLQIVLGGSPTINNFAHPPESHTAARSAPQTSHSCSPSASNVPMAAAAAQGRSTVPTSRSHYTSPPSPIPFPSPHLEYGPSSASVLSPIGSPMECLNGLRAQALVTQSSRQPNTAENPRISHFPSPAVYIRGNAGELRLRNRERVGNNQTHRDSRTADMYESTQRVTFPTPSLPPYSFPGSSANSRHVWSMPEPDTVPDRCDWFIDEREDEDYSDAQ